LLSGHQDFPLMNKLLTQGLMAVETKFQLGSFKNWLIAIQCCLTDDSRSVCTIVIFLFIPFEHFYLK
jgi:hypothetical protein